VVDVYGSVPELLFHPELMQWYKWKTLGSFVVQMTGGRSWKWRYLLHPPRGRTSGEIDVLVSSLQRAGHEVRLMYLSPPTKGQDIR